MAATHHDSSPIETDFEIESSHPTGCNLSDRWA